MTVISQYITFLQENRKLQERGIQNIFNESLKSKFLWIDDLDDLISLGACSSILPNLFLSDVTKTTELLVFPKPIVPQIKVPFQYSEKVVFNQKSNIFESINNSSEDLEEFKNSSEGKALIEGIGNQIYIQRAYSKLYKSSNDLKGDSIIEYVLSVGLIQYSKRGIDGKISKYNQHLFHFPLRTEVDKKGTFRVSFSDNTPYVDFSFLNSVPITKSVLIEIVDTFVNGVERHGYEYLFEGEFKELISHSLLKISEDAEFEEDIFKPSADVYKNDIVKIMYSPALNDKIKKPRHFERLTQSIIEYTENNDIKAELFNFLIRNPESEVKNYYPKINYFTEELFQNYEGTIDHLKSEEDFSTFFPLPFNLEQRQIYENFLKNRLTVVTGPPGTGKSHTIVNILCALLAQGKKILITAQTDKALESLLDKIPSDFDNLVFTKIQLENNRNRFSLERSIENIAEILTNNHSFSISEQIKLLDDLKLEQVILKTSVIDALESEYKVLNINGSFNNLRSYQVIEKFENKDIAEWNWIEDNITDYFLENFEFYKEGLLKIRKLYSETKLYDYQTGFDVDSALSRMTEFNFYEYIKVKQEIHELIERVNLDNYQRNKLGNVDLDKLKKVIENFTENNYVIKDLSQIERLLKQINCTYHAKGLNLNRSFRDVTMNAEKYLIDIDMYLHFSGKGKVSVLSRNFNASFKSVQYLETFYLDGNPCVTGEDMVKLREFIEALVAIDRNISLLKSSGYEVFCDDKSNISDKSFYLMNILEIVQKNKEILVNIAHNSDLLVWSDIIQTSPTDVEQFRKKTYLILRDMERLRELGEVNQLFENELVIINENIRVSPFETQLKDFLPLETISESIVQDFKNLLSELYENRSKEKLIEELVKRFESVLPKSINSLHKVNIGLITKENFEFAHANQTFRLNVHGIDFQQSKETLNALNDKVFDVKGKILYNLALENFRSRFDHSETDKFLNLLNEYKHNFAQSIRGIKNKVRYQLLTKKNREEISEKLSCWVMSFNDVLESMGDKPEVFDCIIIDEASQLDFNALLLGYYSKNMIIVGDDMQTSPISLKGIDSKDFDAIKQKYLTFLGDRIIQIDSGNSLFNLAQIVAGRSNLILKEHFRCVPEIIEFSKFHFYANRLRPLKQKKLNGLIPKRGEFVDKTFSENNIVKREIEAIELCLGKIMEDPLYKNKSVGVVSLGPKNHTESLKYVKGRLVNLYGLEKVDSVKLIISDPSKFQGDERDVMIISLGVGLDIEKLKNNQNAKPNAINSDPEFRRRVNVALSRAKEQMILFHSLKSGDLKDGDFRREIVNFFYEDIKPFPKLETQVSDEVRSRYNVPKPFDSWFEVDVANGLISNGFAHIQPQFKIKEDELYYNHKTGKEHKVNFKLDLVVHSNGKLIAIECDGDPFHSAPDDVFYDVERQEFLERVGWKVYRVLYSDFKRRPFEEIQKIIKFIEKNS